MISRVYVGVIADGGEIEIRVADLLLILVCLAFIPLIIWLIRRFRVSQYQTQRALEQNEELLKLLSQSCSLAEANERHMAAVETKLDEVIEQLKRRPLS